MTKKKKKRTRKSPAPKPRRGWRRRHVELPEMVYADFQGATDEHRWGSSKVLATIGMGWVLSLDTETRRALMSRFWSLTNDDEEAETIEPLDIAQGIAEVLAERGIVISRAEPELAEDRPATRRAKETYHALTGEQTKKTG